MIRSLSFLIPAYNDEKTITTVVEEAVTVGKKLRIPFEIIVINDSSPDALMGKLIHLKSKIRQLRVVTHAKNIGYGGTIRELYLSGSHEWLFTIPGDYQVGARELLKLLPLSKTADMVVGWRTKRNDPVARQRQSNIYNTLLKILFRMPVHDANSVRLMKAAIMKKITLTSTSAFVDAELILRARTSGFRISEAAITHHTRTKGTGSGGGGSLRTILPTIRDMIVFWLQNVINLKNSAR